MTAVNADAVRRLIKRWLALPHRTSASQPYQCVPCRILVELMELLDAVDPVGPDAVADPRPRATPSPDSVRQPQEETTADGIARVRELVANLRIANAEYEKAEGVSALKVASYSLALAARKFLRDFYELDAALSAVLGQPALPRTEK